VERYENLLANLSAHRQASLDPLNSVSTEPDLAQEIGSINRLRDSRDRVSGRSRVTSRRVDKVLIPSAGQESHQLPTVQVSICLFVGHVRAVGPSGHSIVPKSRKPYFLTRMTLVNHRYPSASGWLVSKVSDREVTRCEV